jgi:mannose-1-phosphate guanylyltransferase
MVSAVIVAGGGGTRFWPKSRRNFPKQCIPIVSINSMIEDTAERIKELIPKNNVYMSVGKNIFNIVKSLPMVKGTHFIVEPVARNTAAAIGLSAMKIDSEKKDEIIAILAADHFIEDTEDYLRYLEVAIEIAKEDMIVLIGIKPTRPETGYGYIQKGSIIKKSWAEINSVKAFKEKPDESTAKEYLESREYLWNASMFITKTSVMLDEMKKYMPELYSALENIRDRNFEDDAVAQEFEKLESISIDHGIMEKAYDKLAVITGEFRWDDVGDWLAMERVLELDDSNNAVDADVEGDNEGCIIIGEDKLIEMDGLKDILVVDTKDCLLAASKERAQDVKKIVEMLASDDNLRKYADDFVDAPEFNHVQIDCEKVEVISSKLVATIGLKKIKVEEDEEKIVIKKI